LLASSGILRKTKERRSPDRRFIKVGGLEDAAP
jgi:hypothetical protein